MRAKKGGTSLMPGMVTRKEWLLPGSEIRAGNAE